ncbi:C40 family peptidase [Evansella halocellulosilytica]|uniref:C40 family peptidase n=1 Tax=Evansella halocellulosilytica TaxID=2011013 RepID=UPI000BB86D6C|nr:peptidoglycan-binding protein [Evansella halocellulosilytica]
MSKLKSRKGKVVFTSVVTSAALAPILVNQASVEDKEQSSINEFELLFPSSKVEAHPYRQSMALVPPVIQQTNRTDKQIKTSSEISLSLVPRQTTLRSKELSREDQEKFNQDRDLNHTSLESPWPKDTLLSVGDQGEKVKTIQKNLSDSGYYVTSIDGVFGEKTKDAVKHYQRDHGLKIDGIVGEETAKHILGIKKKINYSAIDGRQKLNPVFVPGQQEHIPTVYTMSENTSQTEEAEERNYYQHGDKGEEIESLQKQLQKAGYYNGSIDGHFGSETQQAIRMLQREHGLSVDGLAGNEVKEFLSSNNLKKIKEERAAQEKENTSSEKNESKEKDESNSSESKSSSSVESVISSAKQLIGSPYVWGGTSPSGFDCSGFLVYVYENNGISLPRTVSDIWDASTSVSSPQRGDFVFFQTYTNGPSHAGIYLGDGDFIHTGTSSGVTVSNLSEDYWQSRYLGAKRY